MARGLDEIRRERGLTVRELLRSSGTAPRTYYNIVSGGGSTTKTETMRKLASALGVEPADVAEFRNALGFGSGPGEEPQREEPPREDPDERWYRMVLRDAMDRLSPAIVEAEYQAYRRRVTDKDEG